MASSAASPWNNPMLDFEERYRTSPDFLIAGCDEAGRGPLAGPLYAAACVFPVGFSHPDIDDSKKLTKTKREALFEVIKKNALSYGIAFCTAEEVDRLNPYMASREAMMRALAKLKCVPSLVVTDAMPLPKSPYPYIDIIKGDAKCLCIAGASILAKVSRDAYMEELDAIYPEYGFKRHKGYGTKEHLEAIKKYGPIKGVHRFSYKNVSEFVQISLF